MKKVYPLIKFKFKLDKFIACMGLFAKEKTGDFSKLKAAKLLYFADKYHLIRYGKPLLSRCFFNFFYNAFNYNMMEQKCL
ncbi:MAG: hypothetical protein ABH844_05350 [Candidatus Omnitrophota bacterium]